LIMKYLSTLTIGLCLFGLLTIPGLCQDSTTEALKSEGSTTSDSAPVKAAPVDNGPASAFLASFSTIVVSELGDKTFFIAAIMAMRYNRIAVLCGALLALFIMTGISTLFGTIVTTLIPAIYTHIITTALFFFFGVKLLYDAYHDEGGENNEKSEVELELNQLHTKLVEQKPIGSEPGKEGRKTVDDDKEETVSLKEPAKTGDRAIDIEAGGSCVNQIEKVASKLVFWQALTLTFLGEWGDRSQIATIALAANSSAVIVFVGAFLGHCLCTGLAVMGGKYLANKISEKMVNMSGGILFLVFGLHNIFFH